MKSITFHSMRINDLSLSVKLGCSPEERAIPQEIRVSAELRFFEEPKGVWSDDLRETVCYAQICEVLREHVERKEFQLVEKLAGDFYHLVKCLVEHRAEISLIVHKVKPPVPGLLGGFEFRVGDFA